MSDQTNSLFKEIPVSELESNGRDARAEGEGDPRLRRPNREQLRLQTIMLDELLPADHDARLIYKVVERLDLSAFYRTIRVRGAQAGRAATDPKLLVALWLYGTMKGVGRGRELARLCESHDAYRWMCGGVQLNYHTLNDFRVGFERELDDLFTQVLASLVHQDVVNVDRISQDGTRVRTCAGRSSFRGKSSLEKLIREMREHIQALKSQLDAPFDDDTARTKKAELRSAKERLARAEEALKELDKVAQAKAKQKDKPSKKNEPKASTTDPDARMMKMPGGGYAPGMNVQLAADVDSRAIVGVDVTNAGSDVHESEPLRRQVAA